MSALNSVADYHSDGWCRVSAIAQLAEIFEPPLQVCTWQRPIDPTINSYLSDATRDSTLQIREVLQSSDRAQLAGLPPGEGFERLGDDVALLTEILCELVDCPSVGLRLVTLENAMCPRWHVDRVPIRMLCTYTGPGTEWLENQEVDKTKLSEPAIANGASQRAEIGEVVLLKGALWQGNTGFGAIHRSPAPASVEERRILLTLDPLWPD